tara:strand:+ start:68 stop:679 length:612 start_codon:yes stop_codon:yes gene_type:complete
MRSFSEIDTTIKRASKAIGFSWGIAEEIGKNIRLLELFGLPGVSTINQYYKIYKKHQFQNISLISQNNTSKIPYCPIIAGVNFLDQIKIMEELSNIKFENIAFPILFIPFASRASEIIGKKILLKIDKIEFLINFNQSIFCNYVINNEIIDISKNLIVEFIDNKDNFNEIEWNELYKLSEETFVEESDDLKEKAAGAGLTDND